MNLEDLDLKLLSRLISTKVERVSCFECCRYYIAPATAPCGHSLCHGCWSGRRSCPYCEAAVSRRLLRLNEPLRHHTEHVHALVENFDKVFNVKLEELNLNTVQPVLPKDPIKHVNDWLASSNNHFSGPMTNSESQTALIHAPNPIELDGSKFQINLATKKINSPKNVAQPLQSQRDWDKIEVMPDTKELAPKNKETIAGPMDIEPFTLDENEYNNEHPRRSNRIKDVNIRNRRVTRTRSRSVDKFIYKNSEGELDKKSTKHKQNWSNVKKMTKEFNKLNKGNKSKLNISIEMSMKAQDNKVIKDGSVKDGSKNPENKSSCIEDATNSDIMVAEFVSKNNLVPNENLNPNVSDCSLGKQMEQNKYGINESKKKIVNRRVSKSLEIQNKTNATKSLLTNKSNDREVSFGDKQTSTDDLPQLQPNLACEETAQSLQIPSLQNISNKVTNEEPDVKVFQSVIDSNNTSNDVEISIKIGSTVTNILIKPKHQDISFKCNTDSAIQTSLGPYNLQADICDKSIDVQSGIPKQTSEKGVNTIEVELGDVNKVTINKVWAAKVDTASAETATAQYKISESFEKELSDAMDCGEENIGNIQSAKSKKKSKSSQNKQVHKTTQDVDENVEDIDDINDYDLFASGSVKEADVHLLKNSKVLGHSEILKPSLKSAKFEKDKKNSDEKDCTTSGLSEIFKPSLKSKKSQKDKRDRGDIDDTEMPRNKRQRVNSLHNERPNTQKAVVEEHDSDPTYDKLMSQVFANIDADIQSSKKSSKNLSLKQIGKELPKKGSQMIQKTQRRTPKEVSPPNNKTRVQQEQKDSENIFSMIDISHQEETENMKIISKSQKESHQEETENVEIISKSEKKNQPNVQTKPSTQQNIDILLTPGLCLGTFKTTTQPDVFSLCDNDNQAENAKVCAENAEIMDTLQACAQAEKDLEMFRGGTHPHDQMEEDMMLLQPVLGTPVMDDDDSESVVEETPQKNMSFQKPKPKIDIHAPKGESNKMSNGNTSQMSTSLINISDTLTPENAKGDEKKDTTVTETAQKVQASETPMSISRFVNQIKHNSTPVAKKSLNFESEGLSDPEQTLCPTTTQEREFMEKAFEKTPEVHVPIRKALMPRNERVRNTTNFCLAGSCLLLTQLTKIKALCKNKGWKFSEKYTDQLTHLVVSVDEDGKSQRTVKYMCALAASKWIVSYAWVEKCLATEELPDEEPFEALDACGEPGPARSRRAPCKLFEGFTFYCMPPFTVLDVDTLKHLITASGGRVAINLNDVQVTGSDVRILLAEPETTQEDRFIYMTLKESLVPVNYEWVLNCLGTYTLCTIKDLLLCPVTILSPHVNTWPQVLLQETDEDDGGE